MPMLIAAPSSATYIDHIKTLNRPAAPAAAGGAGGRGWQQTGDRDDFGPPEGLNW